MLVDQVADAIAVNAAQIQPAPPNVNGVQSRNLLGICRGGDRLVALLDVAAVLEIGDVAGQPAPGEGRTA
jgi:chemotaxis signal transduction protein